MVEAAQEVAWWVWLVLLPAAVYLPLLLHELSHLVVMKATRALIVRFRPWPHFYDGKFWLGYVSCMWPYSDPPAGYRYSHIAPALKSSLMAAGWALAGWQLWTPLWLFAACEAVDWLWWWVGVFRPGKDAYKWFREG